MSLSSVLDSAEDKKLGWFFLFEQHEKYLIRLNFLTLTSTMILMKVYVQGFHITEAVPCYLIEGFSEVLVYVANHGRM